MQGGMHQALQHQQMLQALQHHQALQHAPGIATSRHAGRHAPGIATSTDAGRDKDKQAGTISRHANACMRVYTLQALSEVPKP
jgi:hypothetical protein